MSTKESSNRTLLETVSGARISRIGLGTWGLGGIYYGDVSDQAGINTVRAYVDHGGNHIDTAFAYHKSEEVIGKALKGYPREKLFITSKTYAGSADEAQLEELPEHVEISLRDLQTEYLDCYLIHRAPIEPDLLDTLIEKFSKLKDQGKVLKIGVSVPGPVVTDDTLGRALLALERSEIDMIQLNYSIARQKHRQAINRAPESGTAIIARWVVESGMLTGKYEVGTEFPWPDTRNRYLPPQRDGILQIGQNLKEMLPEGYRSPREIAARFALDEPGVTGIVLGANKPEYAVANLELETLPRLPEELRNELQSRYGAMNDRFNPTGDFEHVPSPRRPIET